MKNLIKVKADIICHGILATDILERIYEHQNPSEMHKQGRYFGIMIKLENKVSVLANVLYENVDKVKYKLVGTFDNLELAEEGVNIGDRVNQV